MRRPVFPRPIVVAALAFTGVAVAITLVVRRVHQHSGYCGTEPVSPVAIVARRDGSATYVACAGTSAALALDRAGRIMRRIALPAPPSGLALSPDETRLAVTCGAAESIVCL